MDCVDLVTGMFGGLVFHNLRESAVVKLLEAGCSFAETATVAAQFLKIAEPMPAVSISGRMRGRQCLNGTRQHGTPREPVDDEFVHWSADLVRLRAAE